MIQAPGLNVALALSTRAREQPTSLAIYEPCGWTARPQYRHYSYRELDEDSDRIARGLAEVGIGAGTRTVLMVPPSLDFFALTFALFKAGAVVVLIDPGMGVRGLGACLNQAAPQAFIGVPRAHIARLLLGWGRGTLGVTVTAGPRLGWGGHTLEELRRRGDRSRGHLTARAWAQETAAILFTSGSTGPAKGVLYTHAIFAAQVEMLRALYAIQPGEIDLPTFPLFGLFGPALGMTAVLPSMDFTRPARARPERLVKAIEAFGVTNLFGSPALLRPLGRYALARGVRLRSLRRVLSAGAPVPWQVLETWQRALPEGVQVYTPYGATEALPVCSIGSDEVLSQCRQHTAAGAGVCVGRPVDGMEVAIVPILDKPLPSWQDNLRLPAGQVGEIAVFGPVVTSSYWGLPEATTLAKIDDPERGGVWHRMGDLGWLDEKGRVWFCGRKSQRVACPSATLFTTPCEGVFNVHPGVARTALVGVRRNGALEPVLCVERDRHRPRISEDDLRRELLALGAAHEHTRGIRTILFHPAFPVDVRHNAKIFREKLAAWAQRQLS